MANVSNPHKKFQFSIEIGVLDPFLCQEVTLPEVESDVVEHGDTNHIIKTAGIKKYGMLTINKIQPASFGADNKLYFFDWIKSIQDPYTGGGDIPDNYKLNARVLEYATDGFTVIGSWEMEGIWPSKINGVELSRTDSENTVESIEFCLDRMVKAHY